MFTGTRGHLHRVATIHVLEEPTSASSSPGTPPDVALGRLDRLRQWRTRPDYDFSVQALVNRVAAEATRHHRRLGAAIDAWEQLVPPHLAALTRVDTLRSGTLQVVAANASAAFELDRLLRAGLDRELGRASNGAVARCRVRTGVILTGEPPTAERAAPGQAPRGSKAGSVQRGRRAGS